MLSGLTIRNIVLIEHLSIDFVSGLSVLTGETGAGKSILLDSLSLALGARGDGGLVRSGEKQGQVTAVFEVSHDHPIVQFLSDNALDDGAEGAGTIILRRVQTADGRTKAFVNDQPTSAGMMRQIGQMLVEIHGQHDDRALVEASAHRSLLDAFGGLEADVASVSTAYKLWRNARQELEKTKARVETAAREADYLRASVEELSILAPADGEETDLADRRQLMMKSEKIATDLNDAYEGLTGNKSPVPTISTIVRKLERKLGEVPGLLDEIVKQMDAALDALGHAQTGLEEAMRSTEFDPQELESSEERLFALRAAARKYSVPVEGLNQLAIKLTQDLADLDAGEELLGTLKAKEAECEAKFRTLAEKLSVKRKKASDALTKVVMAELPEMKLENAEFMVEFNTDPDNAGLEGFDSIEFWVRTNPGTRAGPMMKVASGGELSRFLLALKVALADRGSAPTLVFDEIDTGVGGAVADAIGARLARLAQSVQVLSVTHAPQVAALAGNHMLISKSPAPGASKIATRVEPISGEERQEEIARMLAGAKITDEARAAAKSLMSG